MQWPARTRESERKQAVTLAKRWVDQVAILHAPWGAQRHMQLHSSNTAPVEHVERRRSLHKLQGAMRRAHWLPARPTGHMPDLPVAYRSLGDEGPLRPSRPSRQLFEAVVDRQGEETWIVDPLHLQPAQDPAVTFQRAGFIVHAVQRPGGPGGPKQNCSYLADKAAGALVTKPTNNWKIPEPGDFFDNDKSMTEQHREE